jgi:hypothetical protein
MWTGNSLVVLAALAGGWLSDRPASTPPGKLTPQEKAKLVGRLKCLDLDARMAWDDYAQGRRQVIELERTARSLSERTVKPASPAQAQDKQAVQQAQQYVADAQQLAQRDVQRAQQFVADAQQRLVQLEMERAELLRRLGRKSSGGEADERLQNTLDRILDRLTDLDRRLQRLERRR